MRLTKEGGVLGLRRAQSLFDHHGTGHPPQKIDGIVCRTVPALGRKAPVRSGAGWTAQVKTFLHGNAMVGRVGLEPTADGL